MRPPNTLSLAQPEFLVTARLYAEAVRSAPDLAERHHLARQATRISHAQRG